MITLRTSSERGRSKIDWLDSYHTFSFAHYHDPKHMGFGPLRVISDDVIAPEGGFDMHGHRDMEIITYVLEGALEHKDSLGNGSTILPGDVQRMSAGKGIMHSEFNPSPNNKVHLLQIWIMPNKQGSPASYEQTNFSIEERTNQFRLVASEDGREGSVTIQQDAAMYAAVLKDSSLRFPLSVGRQYWLHVARGEAELNGQTLRGGDAAAITNEQAIELSTQSNAEVLLFDLPK